MTKKNVLIIGKNGQLAQALLAQKRFFSDFGILALGRDELDILDEKKMAEVIEKIRPDFVVNTSALQVMAQCEDNPYDAFDINFLAVKNLAKHCNDIGSFFVTISSDYVFSGEHGPNKEDDYTKPLQFYGLSKLAGECATTAFCDDNSYIIRTCGLYGGLSGSHEKGNFVLNRLKEAADKKVVEVSSEQIVSPTNADDLAVAILKLIELEAKPGVYHLVNEGYCSWCEFTKEIYRLSGIDKEVRPVDRGGYSDYSNRPKFSALENTKAKALGIVLPNWQDGLARYIEFLRENGRL